MKRVPRREAFESFLGKVGSSSVEESGAGESIGGRTTEIIPRKLTTHPTFLFCVNTVAQIRLELVRTRSSD